MLVILLTGIWCASLAEEAQASGVLQITPAELSVEKGQGKKITPKVSELPKGVRLRQYTWNSADESIATCKDGGVRGIAGGQTTVTCTAELSDGSRLTAACTVTVMIPVTGVHTDTKTIKVMAGESFVPPIQVLPEDATNKQVVYSSSDEAIVRIGENGEVLAVAEGETTLTAASQENPAKQIKYTVTVTKLVGKTEKTLKFQGLEWESDSETCFRKLKESGFLAEEATDRTRGTSEGIWHWPEQDLQFSRNSAWRSLPEPLANSGQGGGIATIAPRKTVGGFIPHSSSLLFLNGKNTEGQYDPAIMRLTGVYFNFNNKYEKGTTIFCELLKKLEEQYGDFKRYLHADLSRYYPDIYSALAPAAMEDAQTFQFEEEGLTERLGEYAICVMYGADHTGIMLNMDITGNVTLFYGRTDAMEMIRDMQAQMTVAQPENLEDAGV